MSFQRRADALLRRLLALTDLELEGEFWWRRGGQQDDFYRRHGLYQVSELILEAADHMTPMDSEGTALVGHLVRASWDLRAILLTLDEDLVGREPRPGEWSIAQAMDHMLGSQEFWNILFDLWLEQARRGEQPAFRLDGKEIAARRSGGDQLVTSPEALLAELEELVAHAGHVVVELDALGLLREPEVGFNRGPVPVPLGYYPRRWAAHLREHTVQLDKTLAWLGVQPTEQQRIARVTAGALGELEAAWWRAGRPSGLEEALAPAERHLDAVLA